MALGKSYEKTEQPYKLYPDLNGESTDGKIAGRFKDGESYGYIVPKGGPKEVSIIIHLSSEYYVNNIKVHKYEGNAHYSADEVTVYTSLDGKNFALQGS